MQLRRDLTQLRERRRTRSAPTPRASRTLSCTLHEQSLATTTSSALDALVLASIELHGGHEQSSTHAAPMTAREPGADPRFPPWRLRRTVAALPQVEGGRGSTSPFLRSPFWRGLCIRHRKALVLMHAAAGRRHCAVQPGREHSRLPSLGAHRGKGRRVPPPCASTAEDAGRSELRRRRRRSHSYLTVA